MPKNYYFYWTLGIDSNSDKNKIKNSYRELAKKWHPDRFGSPNHLAKSKEEARVKMTEINEAYEVLMNEDESQSDKFICDEVRNEQTPKNSTQEYNPEMSEGLRDFFENNREAKSFFDKFSKEGKDEFCKNW